MTWLIVIIVAIAWYVVAGIYLSLPQQREDAHTWSLTPCQSIQRDPARFLVRVALMPLVVLCTVGVFSALIGSFACLEVLYFLSYDEDRHYVFTPPEKARWWRKMMMFLFVIPPRILLGITMPTVVETYRIFMDPQSVYKRKNAFSLPPVPWTQVRENAA